MVARGTRGWLVRVTSVFYYLIPLELFRIIALARPRRRLSPELRSDSNSLSVSALISIPYIAAFSATCCGPSFSSPERISGEKGICISLSLLFFSPSLLFLSLNFLVARIISMPRKRVYVVIGSLRLKYGRCKRRGEGGGRGKVEKRAGERISAVLSESVGRKWARLAARLFSRLHHRRFASL